MAKKPKMTLREYCEQNPEKAYLLDEWDYEANFPLTPDDVTAGSGKKVWWHLPYDDFETGKHFDFEWETAIILRSQRSFGCPYLSGQAVWTGYNDLFSTDPELVKEWHPTKNGNLKPTEVTRGSERKAWWYLPYDDPKTGKHFDFEWEAVISSRANGIGCPFLSGKAVWVGFNDLVTTHPLLAKEWHPTKNGDLKPINVTAGSGLKVWWCFPYDDPNTGKHFDFEWKADICSRTSGNGCPYLIGQAVWIGYNDFATGSPDIAKEWHPTKNGDLKPTDITTGSNKKVWWLLPYDVPIDYPVEHLRGKHFDFEWEAFVNDRAKGIGCPYLSNPAKSIWVGFNDLATTHPELAKEWHPTKNGNLKPMDVMAGSSKKIWWLLPYDDPQTGKHFDFEWEAIIENRTKGTGCPYLSNKKIWKGYNDLTSTNPELVKEWHPIKNRELTPFDVTICSGKKVWWQCQYGHEWKATIAHRTNGEGCPTCAKGNNTSFAEQAIYYYVKQYFPDAINGDKTVLEGRELDIYIPSLRTGIEYDGELFHKDAEKDLIKNDLAFQKKIHLIRIREPKLPKLNDDRVDYIFREETSKNKSLEKCINDLLVRLNILSSNIYVDIDTDLTKILNQIHIDKKKNSLQELFPDIAKEWHPFKNGSLTPDMFATGSDQKIWWYLPYDDPKTGKHFDFEWQTSIYNRTSKGLGCPYLSGQAIWIGYNDLMSTHPELAYQWHPSKNGKLTTEEVTAGTTRKVWWYYPYDDPNTGKHFDFEWESAISSRTQGVGCPFLSGRAVWIGFNDLATTHPELSKSWNYEKNKGLKDRKGRDISRPEFVTAGSNLKVWWICEQGHEWESMINNRARGNNCPICATQKEKRIESEQSCRSIV